jgi:hypothetical protein
MPLPILSTLSTLVASQNARQPLTTRERGRLDLLHFNQFGSRSKIEGKKQKYFRFYLIQFLSFTINILENSINSQFNNIKENINSLLSKNTIYYDANTHSIIFEFMNIHF